MPGSGSGAVCFFRVTLPRKSCAARTTLLYFFRVGPDRLIGGIVAQQFEFRMGEVGDLSSAMSSLRLPAVSLPHVIEDLQLSFDETSPAKLPFSDSTNRERVLSKVSNQDRAFCPSPAALYPSPTVASQSLNKALNHGVDQSFQVGSFDCKLQDSTFLADAETTSFSPQSDASTCSPASCDQSILSPSILADASPPLVTEPRMPTLIICDDIFAKHKTGKSCQECPERVAVLCGSRGTLRSIASGHLQWENHCEQVRDHVPT